jgi:hypothetical protein
MLGQRRCGQFTNHQPQERRAPRLGTRLQSKDRARLSAPDVRSYASFFCRLGEISSRGAVRFVTVPSIILTSVTSSRLGRSNITSVRISSRIARKPRAPVPRLSALAAIARSACSSKVSLTSSRSNSFAYCLESVFVERLERHAHGQSTDELRDQPIAQQIVGLHVGEGVLRGLGDRPRDGVAIDLFLGEPDLLSTCSRLDDLLEPIECAAADEEDVLRVDLDVLLLRVLASALRRHRRDGAFENLQQRLLHALAGHIARDAGVLRLARDLIDLVDVDDPTLALGDVEVAGLQQPHEDVLNVFPDVSGFRQRRGVGDGERNIEDAGERLSEQRLADAGRADQQNVRLVELDLIIAQRCRVDALVVIVDRDGECLFRAFLTDHVLVEDVLDFLGRRDLRDRFRDFALFVLSQDLVAEGDALIADIDRRSRDELPDRVLRLATERAAQVLIVGHGRGGGRRGGRRAGQGDSGSRNGDRTATVERLPEN